MDIRTKKLKSVMGQY